jgi:hypothetical protein
MSLKSSSALKSCSAMKPPFRKLRNGLKTISVTSFNQAGANWDALGQIPEINGKKPDVMTGSPPKQAIILFTAAFMRCMGTKCRHAVAERQIALHAILAPRVLSCEECLPRFIEVCQKHDAERQRSDECDLCLKQGVKVFRPFSVAWNGIVFQGDVCPECDVVLGH